MFICLEGIDASGKATQAKLLAERLDAKLFSFPDYTTPMGKLIEGHLKRYWAALPSTGSVAHWPDPSQLRTLDAMVFQSLQLSNRMEHATELRTLKEQGKHVVADRYWPSGWVYGTADGLEGAYLWRLHEHLPQPDLFLLMKIDPKVSSIRRPERRDRYEKQAGLMERVADLYAEFWHRRQAAGDIRWCTVDAEKPIDEVADFIWREVQARLKGC